MGPCCSKEMNTENLVLTLHRTLFVNLQYVQKIVFGQVGQPGLLVQPFVELERQQELDNNKGLSLGVNLVEVLLNLSNLVREKHPEIANLVNGAYGVVGQLTADAEMTISFHRDTEPEILYKRVMLVVHLVAIPS